MEQWYQALSGRANLLSPGWLYPVKHTLGYTDVLLGLVPIYAPFRAAGIDMFTALALTVVVVTVLDYVLCFVLLRRILRLNLLASCAGAFFFAFNDPKVAQPDHIQIQALYFLPIAAGALILLFRDLPNLSQRRAFALLAVAALAIDLELLTAYYDAWFFVFWAAILLVLALALGRTRAFLVSFARRYARPLAGGAAVFIAGLVPFLLIYVPVLRSLGTQPYSADVGYIPEPRSFLLAADHNYVWQSLTTHILGAGGPDYGRRLNIGAVATVGWLALSVLALLLVWRSRRAAAGEESRIDERTALLVLALGILAVDVVLVLALQYHGHSPWKIVYHLVPGAKGLRAISRDVIILALPMAIVFAVGIHRLSGWVLRRTPGLARSGLGARARPRARLWGRRAAQRRQLRGLVLDPGGERPSAAPRGAPPGRLLRVLSRARAGTSAPADRDPVPARRDVRLRHRPRADVERPERDTPAGLAALCHQEPGLRAERPGLDPEATTSEAGCADSPCRTSSSAGGRRFER